MSRAQSLRRVRKAEKEIGASLRIPRRSNKYGAKATVYNGRRYHSKREAAYAAELDLKVKAGLVAEWVAQPSYSLCVNGNHVCIYRADFLINYPAGNQVIVDVKGHIDAQARIKMALYNALREANGWPPLEVVR